MITRVDLGGFGFEYLQTPWKTEKMWIYTYDGKDTTNFIISYDVDKQIAKAVLGEFSIISRTCNNGLDICKFILAIEFLENKKD